MEGGGFSSTLKFDVQKFNLKLPNLPILHLGGWGGGVSSEHLETWFPRIQLDLIKWHFEIWSPKIQLDLKLLNLPTFHFTGWGGGGGSKNLRNWGAGGGRLGGVKQAFWNLQSKNPTWHETSKSSNFLFFGGGGSSKLWSGTLKSEVQLPTFYFMEVGWEGVVKQHFEI